MSRIGALTLALAMTLLSACGSPSTATQPLTLAPTTSPTLTVPVATRTPPPTLATAAPLPSETAPASPTSAQLATLPPAATKTPSPTQSPTPVPAGFNPLTGEIASDTALLSRPPLAVKVVNEPSCARPQFGLEQAAVVFEHYVEAWGTRFTAIFYGEAADRIGAVRSARLIDLELPAIFDAILVTSGSSGGVRQRLERSDFAGRVIAWEWQHECPPLCQVPIETVACGDIEHTMFTRLPDLLAAAQERGLDQPPSLSGWTFSPSPPPRGQPATGVRVGYLNSPVDWRYEPANGRYHRWQDGVRHLDANTQRRLTAANVVVLFAHHTYTDIRESPNFYSLEIQFWGQGPALIFRDGLAYHATWVRAERKGLFRLVDSAGRDIPLKPGRTWYEFVALASPVAVAATDWTITASVLPQQTPPR